MRPEEEVGDRVEWHLENWAAWMHGKGNRLSWPSRASGGMSTSSTSDFDAMVANADNRCAIAVDAVLESITPPHRAAVYTMHLGDLFPAVYRFRRPVETYYAEARDMVLDGLTRRGIW